VGIAIEALEILHSNDLYFEVMVHSVFRDNLHIYFQVIVNVMLHCKGLREDMVTTVLVVVLISLLLQIPGQDLSTLGTKGKKANPSSSRELQSTIAERLSIKQFHLLFQIISACIQCLSIERQHCPSSSLLRNRYPVYRTSPCHSFSCN